MARNILVKVLDLSQNNSKTFISWIFVKVYAPQKVDKQNSLILIVYIVPEGLWSLDWSVSYELHMF